MVARKALIIGCPDKDIPGVLVDMENYRRFFQSSSGGAWYSNEIEVLKSPSTASLQSAVRRLQNADYSIVVFAGHGGYSNAKQTTLLQLSPGVSIEEHELKDGAPRHTVIIDACRVHLDKPVMEEYRAKAMAFDSADNPARSRMLFDNHIRACAPGLAVMHSCSIGEGAQETTDSGGLYSSILIRVGENRRAGTGQVLTISEAHADATALVRRETRDRQIPRGMFPRTLPRFPFAVDA
ncbi:caspase family protein [Trinickia dinghuensis]|uniref:Caspase family protein n=1 Tax=Trinickia dinghuensis TaxID=2291023 RepID=A0A3D8K0I4_9BURK|nr:caspase family protein [Trinickia dinghuensis]RDU98947.1 caspase family protein [Trinickia dinghuensis]